MATGTKVLPQLFRHGSTWLRADFHLHTRKDGEFGYAGEDDRFVSDYVSALVAADIRVGVISNHNKFDFDEFRALRKRALKEEIFLLPGIELSVNDGANGIHTLVIFSDDWIENGQDHINPFLGVAFEGKLPSEYERENGRSSLNLIDTIKRLEGYHRDFFLVFAHVEAQSGLWSELKGGRIEELGQRQEFRRRALGFQKIRTHDQADRVCRTKVQQWLGDAYPAEVEGCDCKRIEDIGRGKTSYLKIGDFSFAAVKFALSDHQSRVAAEPPQHKGSHILSASFEGGVFDGATVNFSPALNTLIGIRGGGKSSLLEAIRYALDIPFGARAMDRDYKDRLVGHVLGSGGKVTVRARDRYGRAYEVRRIYKEQPDVYVDGGLQPGISIRETVLYKPIYFGQKDLSSTGAGFEQDLVEKLIGEKLGAIRVKIEDQRQRVAGAAAAWIGLAGTAEKKQDYDARLKDAEYQMRLFQQHGVEQRLQKQVDFDADSTHCSRVIAFADTYLADLEEFINRYVDELDEQTHYQSRQNDDLFQAFFASYTKLLASFALIKKALTDGRQAVGELRVQAAELQRRKDGLKEKFAGIERQLAEDLAASGAPAIPTSEFRKLRQTIDQARLMIDALDKQGGQRDSARHELLIELAALNDLWHQEYQAIQANLDKVNRNHSSLLLKSGFKGDKHAFVGFMKDLFRGSRLREATLSTLADEFADFADMFKRLDRARELAGSAGAVFEQYFLKNLSALLTWQVPNRFTIEYRGKELKDHSLGQRASALILFILSQQENDVLIIDQPEDDLDNQTIYQDVIKLIIQLKPMTQFIFATHNANFPVLGDAEQVMACDYSRDTVEVVSGSIDRAIIQQRIVEIMEGGEEAFRQRNRIYEIWKPRNS